MKGIKKGRNIAIPFTLFITIMISLLYPYVFSYPVSATGTTYYVSTSGSDSNAGTLAHPWRTIQKAANTVTSGDTVYIREGLYTEKITLSNLQGTSTAWVTFSSYNSETVIVDGYNLGGIYDGIFMVMDGCKYIRITGLEMKRTTSHGIFLNGGEITNIRIDHCTIHDCQSSGIYCYSGSQPSKYVRNVEFDNNNVYDVNNGYAYDDSHALSPQEAISFSNVQGFNIHHNTLSQYGKEGIDAKSGSSNGLIHHNTITTSRSSPSFQWDYNHIGIYIDGYIRNNHDISVYSNKITGYGGTGIAIGAESGGSIENINIYNNDIGLSYSSGHINFRGIDSCYDCLFKNVYIYCNTIYNGGSTTSPIRIFPSATHIVNVVIANNIFSGTAYYLLSFQELRSTEVAGRLTLKNNLYYCFGDTGHNEWKNGVDKSWGTNYLINDPKFLSRSGYNLQLQNPSPAINAGSSSPAPSTDFNGVSRPQGNGIDIGAYEYIQTVNNPPVFSGMNPSDGASNIPLTLGTLSLYISDPEGGMFSYSIETSPDVGSISVNNVYASTKYCTLSGLAYGRTYRWWVNASDGSSWTRRSYTFTTVSNPVNSPPVFSGMNPSDGAMNIPLGLEALSVYISDPEGKMFSYSIETSPDVGSISVNNVYASTKYCTLSGLAYGRTYRWWVNASDGSSWTRRSYKFTTAQDPSSGFVFSAITPADRSSNIPINTSQLSLMIQNTKGHAFNYEFKTNPDVGSKIRTYNSNGIKTCDLSGLTYGTTYYWYIFCKDITTGQWSNQSYRFTTEYKNPYGGSGGSSPPSGGDPPINGTEPPSPPENNPPYAPLKPFGPTTFGTGEKYYFSSSAFDPDVNDTIRLQFNWGDGTVSEWTNLLPSNVTVSFAHSWQNASSYNITVIAQDKQGLNSSWSEPITVLITSPTSQDDKTVEIYTSSNQISAQEPVRFNALSTLVPDTDIVSYRWEFGDGNISDEKSAAHTYTNPGNYTVSLEIMDRFGEIYNKKINLAVSQGNTEGDSDFTSIILLGLLIGLIFALLVFLLIFTQKTKYLRVFITYGIRGKQVLTRFLIKSMKTTRLFYMKTKTFTKTIQNRFKAYLSHRRSLKQKKPTRVRVPKAVAMPSALDEQPARTFSSGYHHSLMCDIHKVDEAELLYIHEKLDQMILE
jgi:hypothetical protein